MAGRDKAWRRRQARKVERRRARRKRARPRILLTPEEREQEAARLERLKEPLPLIAQLPLGGGMAIDEFLELWRETRE